MHQDGPLPLRHRGEHRPQLDGVRFFAFLGIFAFHCNVDRFAAGRLGVPLFFALSGFLITRILLRNESDSFGHDIRTFYARRALRIFPLYYLVLIVLQACGRLDRPWISYGYLYNLDVYAHGEFVGSGGHFWTLAVEEQFYLVFPLLLLATPARWRAAMLISLLAACAVSRLLLDRFAPSPFTMILPNVAGEYLIAGAIAGYLDVVRPGVAASRLRFAGAAMLSGFAAMWASGSRFGIAWLDPVVPDLTALAFAVLTWELWRCQGPVARLLSLRPLVYLGKISYGCYIFHLFAIQENARVINALHLNALPVRSRSLVALAVTILAAIASWHLFEAPILSIKSRFAYGRRVTIPVDARPAGTTLASS